MTTKQKQHKHRWRTDNVTDTYSEGVWFESWLGYRLMLSFHLRCPFPVGEKGKAIPVTGRGGS
jgi:hypothetical protein